MRLIDSIEFLNVDTDLAVMSLDAACNIHEEKTGFRPVTLVCSIRNAKLAYEIMANKWINRLLIVAVPGFPSRLWFVCSPEFAVGSGGS